MLSPAGFTSPFEHLSQDETKLAVQAYMAFLNDNTELIATPGIKVSTDSSTLMLSPAGFTSPFEHLDQDETKLPVEAYIAFLNDNTGLIATPGIKVK